MDKVYTNMYFLTEEKLSTRKVVNYYPCLNLNRVPWKIETSVVKSGGVLLMLWLANQANLGVREQFRLGGLRSVARIYSPLLARKSSGFARIWLFEKF